MARVFSWAGALLFFFSLSYFLFAYAVTFAVVGPPGRLVSAVAWNVLLFTVFACHHSVFARARVRAWITSVVPNGLERSVYVWIASLLFLAVMTLWQPVPGVAWRAEGAWLWTLRGLQMMGGVLSLWSATIIDIFELNGLRQHEAATRTSQTAGAGEPEFKTRGPYGWVRHPIYSGWCLMVFAVSQMTMTRLVFAVVSTAYLVMAIPLEERSMRASAPRAYERYLAQVRWRLIPGVY